MCGCSTSRDFSFCLTAGFCRISTMQMCVNVCCVEAAPVWCIYSSNKSFGFNDTLWKCVVRPDFERAANEWKAFLTDLFVWRQRESTGHMSHARPVRTSVNNLISVVFYSHYTFYVATPTERLPSGRQTIKNATRIIQPVVESTLCFNCSPFTAFTVRSATLHCLPFSVLCVCVCVWC